METNNSTKVSLEQMKTITFIRHGQSVANAGGVTVAHHAIPLTALGETQAAALSKMLPDQPARILTSPFIRAQQTAVPFTTRVGISAEVHPLIYEFDNFDLNQIAGMTGAEREPLRDAFWQAADPDKRMGPAAETFAEFEQRVQAFLPHLQALPDKTIVFGHGMWVGMLIWKLLGFRANDSLGMSAFRRFQVGLPMPNCAVYHVHETAPGTWHAKVDEALIRKVREVGLVNQ
jgi:alpha-ribazole phosphatase